MLSHPFPSARGARIEIKTGLPIADGVTKRVELTSYEGERRNLVNTSCTIGGAFPKV
jgi:hypothetical protein